jgi:hypothetical protein
VSNMRYKVKTYATDEIVALAFAAHRHNNGYIKSTVRMSEPDKKTIWSNKELVSYTIASEIKNKADAHHVWIPEDFIAIETTDADVNSIEVAKNYVKRYLVGMMSNDITAFQQEVHDALMSDEIPVTKIGLVSYIPELIAKEKAATILKKQLKTDFADSVALTGKLSGMIEVINCRYVEKHEAHAVMASLGKDLVKFFHKEPVQTGNTFNITAKAKDSYPDPRTKCTVTYINYVKFKKK